MPTRRPFGLRELALALLGVLIVALLAFAAADWLEGDPAHGQQAGVHVYAYPERPPGFEDVLWPALGGACRRGVSPPGGLSNGVIRSNGAAWEVLEGGDLAQWVTFNPRNPRASQVYYMVGPTWVNGECTSNIHGEAQSWLAELYGISTLELRMTRPMEAVQLDYFQPFVDNVRQRYCVRFPASCGGGGGDGEPVATPTPRPTPTPPCRPPCIVRGGGICDCPSPTPTPRPTATPTPTATPCPSPTPCPTCPPAVQTERMPLSIRATINKGIGALGKQWRTQVAEARKWLDEHPLFAVPFSDRSTPDVGELTLEPWPAEQRAGATAPKADCSREPEYEEKPGEPSFHAMGRYLEALIVHESACGEGGK